MSTSVRFFIVNICRVAFKFGAGCVRRVLQRSNSHCFEFSNMRRTVLAPGLWTEHKARLSLGFLLRVNIKVNQKRPVRVKT